MPSARTQRLATVSRMSEEAIHRTVVAHLARRARPGVVYAHVPNGEARGAGLGGKLKALGTRAGMPDLIALHAGQFYALELKREGGRLTESQRQTLADLEAAGALTAVAYGLDDALGRLSSWGLLR
ncbi:MAG: VRR-NUC domain-containing protein [Hyphomicrobiaceae bacterium]|nr:VRR-NUC domain-containing protein [Hyphomicrobiaceae bacterium]